MIGTGRGESASRPAGYAALVERYGVDVIPNWHASRVAGRGVHRIRSHAGVVEETFPARYRPGDTPGDQLEFALKHDGTNLAILATLFGKDAGGRRARLRPVQAHRQVRQAAVVSSTSS